jgi:hypothetical protein
MKGHESVLREIWRSCVRFRLPALVVLAVVAALWLALFAPRLLVPMPSLESLRDVTNPVIRHQLLDDRFKLQNDVRTTLLQGIGGGVLLVGVYLTFRQYKLNQEGHLTERFTRAVDQLGNDKIAIRVGGIYALGRIARDSARDHEPVMETLAAFVREQSNELRQSNRVGSGDGTPRLRGDLQAAATILGNRPESRQSEESRRINLRDACLGRAHLRQAHYEDIALTNADFTRAQLTGIHLDNCPLRKAIFQWALLNEAHLAGAFLIGANLCHARLTGVDLEGAWLFGANLEGAQLDHAVLARAYFDTDPIISWLQETLHSGPWDLGVLIDHLDTPSDEDLSAFQVILTRPAARPADKAQLKEALRQIGFFLEAELAESASSEVGSARVAQALKLHGIDDRHSAINLSN